MENNSVQNPGEEKVFVSWSGGKDAYLSLLLAREQGLEIKSLLNFAGHDGYSRSHGLPRDLLERQAEALDLPLEKEEVTWETYQEGFIRAVERLKDKGMTGGVFGDINLEEHREWLEKMARHCGFNCYLPLWGMGERQVTEELVHRGVTAIIVSLKSELVKEEWLGQPLGQKFLEYSEKAGISPCGERGEFHTLVVDGPGFREPMQYRVVKKENKGERAILRLA